jgi:hypothetical protein
VLVRGNRLRDFAPGRQGLHQQPVARLSKRHRHHQLACRALSRGQPHAPKRHARARNGLERPQPQLSDLAAPLLDPQGVVAREEATPCDLGGRRRCLPRGPEVTARNRSFGTVGCRVRVLDVDLHVGWEHERQLAAPAQPILADCTSKLGHQRAQRLIGIGRECGRPQHRDQLIAADRPLTVEHQQRKDERQLTAGKTLLDPLATDLDLQPSAQPNARRGDCS